MDVASIRNRIEALVDEERSLHASEQADAEQRSGEPLESDRERLEQISLQLDQCWDLLRQRRALRETGGDPEQAQIRPPDIVEKYVG
jgi:hypothetical protein